ncbi:hypothetical protein ACIPY3_09465 [Paenarthrobacter sp. NPDC089714]|uniref:hypothetical protein n=1 Tax=Paenarthrobacter sp. NPDC089714 TaxID=3364377 RepID=UPI0038145468
MSKFASTRVLSDLADTLKSITVTQGTAHHVNIDGEPALGWALLATGATGIACQYHDRVVMWLGTEQAVMPGSIRTTMALPDQAGRIF